MVDKMVARLVECLGARLVAWRVGCLVGYLAALMAACWVE